MAKLSQTFDIDGSALPEIEQRLFQMNIHEQSLFPDMEGLAGLIRQSIRLHGKSSRLDWSMTGRYALT